MSVITPLSKPTFTTLASALEIWVFAYGLSLMTCADIVHDRMIWKILKSILHCVAKKTKNRAIWRIPVELCVVFYTTELKYLVWYLVCLVYFWVDLREGCSRNKTWKSYWYLHLISWKSLPRSSSLVHFCLNQTLINDVLDDSYRSCKPPWTDIDITVPGLMTPLLCDIFNIPNRVC